jgi:hypothetical protein
VTNPYARWGQPAGWVRLAAVLHRRAVGGQQDCGGHVVQGVGGLCDECGRRVNRIGARCVSLEK